MKAGRGEKNATRSNETRQKQTAEEKRRGRNGGRLEEEILGSREKKGEVCKGGRNEGWKADKSG